MEHDLTANGLSISREPANLGPLRSSTELLGDGPALRTAFMRDGYLFLPGLIDDDLVLAARHEILTKYAIIGEVDDRAPVMDGIAGDRHGLATANLRAFTESVRTGASYEAAVFAPPVLEVVQHLLEADPVPFTMRWKRPGSRFIAFLTCSGITEPLESTFPPFLQFL